MKVEKLANKRMDDPQREAVVSEEPLHELKLRMKGRVGRTEAIRSKKSRRYGAKLKGPGDEAKKASA